MNNKSCAIGVKIGVPAKEKISVINTGGEMVYKLNRVPGQNKRDTEWRLFLLTELVFLVENNTKTLNDSA
jgi:hypothetical protein